MAALDRGRPPDTISAFAPGRVEILGNHTDYNEGVVLGAAIDRGLTVSGAKRDDDKIVIRSDLMGRIETQLSRLHPQAETTWANYALGVVRELMRLGVAIEGFSAEIESNLPLGCGLSSSAAFEVATALFLLRLHQRELDRMELAKMCQRAAHNFVGVQSGLLDEVMSIFGRANHLVFFDTRSEDIQLIPFPDELAFVISESGTSRALAHGEYNIRWEQTHAAARALGVKALRDVSSIDVKHAHNLDPLLKRRALHVVEENERVLRALALLKEGKSHELGELMNASHQSSRENFENSIPELDLLVELARKLPGILGARLTGAGFGGAIIALCERSQAGAAAKELRRSYKERTGTTSQSFVCQIADGGKVIGEQGSSF